MQIKTIVSPSFPVFCIDLQEAIMDGYELDQNNLPVANMILFEANLIKHDSADVKQLKEEAFPVNLVSAAEGAETKRKPGRPAKTA